MPEMRIAAVARATGIAIDTIRAWERRYALVRPARTQAGVRLYSDADVSRLRLARDAVALGHPIGMVSRLSDGELRKLGAPRVSSAAPDGPAAIVSHILEAGREYDLARAQQLLGSAAMMMTPLDLIAHVLVPLMHGVGEGVQARRMSIAQEHAISNQVRNVMGSLSRLQPAIKGRTLLFATPPDELHEFGTLFAATVAALQGYESFVLGTNVPASEVARAARAIGPSGIVVGITRDPQPRRIAQYLRELRRRLPSATAIILGGRGAAGIPASALPAGTAVTAALADFAAHIGSGRP